MLDYSALQEAIQTSYEDTCTVFAQETEPIVDPDTFETIMQPVVLYENLPCRISFASSDTDDKEMHDSATQTAKLFVGPNVDIPPGSEITVNRRGNLMDFGFSGLPAFYPSHREYVLTAKDRYL